VDQRRTFHRDRHCTGKTELTHRKNKIGSQEKQIQFRMLVSTAPHWRQRGAPSSTEMRSTELCEGRGRPRRMAVIARHNLRGGSGAGSTRNDTGKDRYSPRKSGRRYQQSVADYAGSGSIESKPIPEFVIVSKGKRLKEEERRPRLRPTPRAVTNDGGGGGGGDDGGDAFPSPSLRAAPASPRPPSR
jgi:hypothetical protein